MIRIFILALVFLQLETGWGQTLTLDQSIQFSFKHNPIAMDAKQSIKVKESFQKQASSLLNPELNLEYEEEDKKTILSYSQKLELGGKRSYKIKIAQLNKELSELKYKNVALNLIEKVTLDYINTWLSYQEFEISKQLERLSKEVFETISERRKRGKDSPLIQTNSRIEWINAKVRRRQSSIEYEKEKSELSQYWGEKNIVFTSLDPPGILLNLPKLELFFEFFDKSIDIKIFQLKMKLSDLTLQFEESQNTPDLTINLGVQKSGDIVSGIVGFSVPLTIFDKNLGEISKANYSIESIERKKRSWSKQKKRQLVQQYEALEELHQEILLIQKDLLPSSKELFQATQEGYKEGKFSFLDVLNVQRTYTQMRQNYFTMMAEYFRYQSKIERLIGKKINTIKRGTS